jgi:cation transport regulator ChaC
VNFYFSYGSCMNAQDFRRTAPNAVRLGPGTLRGYRLGFTRYSTVRRGGVADIVQDAESAVEGIVWLVPNTEMQQVDAREGALDGIYRRILVQLKFLNEIVHAFTYEVVDKRMSEFPPSAPYANLIVTGALELSPSYQRWLIKHISNLYDKQKDDIELE